MTQIERQYSLPVCVVKVTVIYFYNYVCCVLLPVGRVKIQQKLHTIINFNLERKIAHEKCAHNCNHVKNFSNKLDNFTML